MRNRFRIGRDWLAWGAMLLGVSARVSALDVTNWQHRQTVALDRAGVVKFTLPPATLDVVRPGLDDLRLLDPAGREVPFAIERPAAAETAAHRVPRPFRAELIAGATQITFATDTTAPLVDVVLAAATPAFLKPAQVEISSDGAHWETVQARVPVFRQFGSEQLRLDLGHRTAAQVRITLDDTRTRPVALTGVALGIAATRAPAPTEPLPVRVAQRDEFTGETVLMLDVGGANVTLASLTFGIADSLFTRRVTLAVRELKDGLAAERQLGEGVIYRIAGEGLPLSARLDVPIDRIAPSRELLVHIANGDSPPLAVTDVRATQHPTWMVFSAASSGAHVLLGGNPDVAAPRYDLAALSPAFKDVAPTVVTFGALEAVPGYQRPDPLATLRLRGGALDPSPWAFRKAVRVTQAGVQQLELDLDVLSGAQRELGDLRLVRDGAQVPYLLERPSLTRPTALLFTAVTDSKRPSVSHWQIKLPRAGIPINQLTLVSPLPLFERRLRLFEKLADDRGGTYERVLADGIWSKSPGNDRPLVLRFPTAPTGATLELETENGDNPPLVLGGVTASCPVTRLLFYTEGSAPDSAAGVPIALYYGNPQANAPRYDLALVAAQIIAAEKNVAGLGKEEGARAGGWLAGQPAGLRAGIVFWSVLALVVIGLLVVVARLLPAAPAPK